ncbi:MAG: FHIPEP family type III secretion protein [Chromatiales bacterium]|nr:FHIPEP family type III secretion protein [Chromatiales bacterium]
MQPVDALGLEVGYRLIPLVDKAQGGRAADAHQGRAHASSRRNWASWCRPVHIRDNLDLRARTPTGISLLGRARSARPRSIRSAMLAINPGQVYGTPAGPRRPRIRPSACEAVWIEPRQRDQAQTLGYTVVDRGDRHRDPPVAAAADARARAARARGGAAAARQPRPRARPSWSRTWCPKTLPLATVREGAAEPARGTGADPRHAHDRRDAWRTTRPQSQDAGVLTGAGARGARPDQIVQQINGLATELPVITLGPGTGTDDCNSRSRAGPTAPASSPGWPSACSASLARGARSARSRPASRRCCWCRRDCARCWRGSCATRVPGLTVLAYNEIPGNKQIRIVATVGR